MKVVFTERAYLALLSETAEKVYTETGGIFLGYREDDVWHVVETIDPGPHSVFEVAYFEYDQKYVNHLAQKIARLYEKPLELVGLWHRHPGSFDRFSGTDDGTNKQYASLHKDGAISALVNIDPEFRLTVYHVQKPLRYTKVEYSVEKESFPLCNEQRLLDYLGGKTASIRGDVKRRPKLPYFEIVDGIINVLPEMTEKIEAKQVKPLSDDDVAFLLEQTETDAAYLGDCYLEVQMSLQENYLQINCKGKKKKPLSLHFFVHPVSRKCCLEYRRETHDYEPGMFKAVLEDIITCAKQNVAELELNEEFVQCSLEKLHQN